MASSLPQFVAVLVPIGVQLVVFLRWLHRRIRDDEINRAFVHDVTTNHLPHIYDALLAIAEQQGIVIARNVGGLGEHPGSTQTCGFGRRNGSCP